VFQEAFGQQSGCFGAIGVASSSSGVWCGMRVEEVKEKQKEWWQQQRMLVVEESEMVSSVTMRWNNGRGSASLMFGWPKVDDWI
jgi:hypothetical protein